MPKWRNKVELKELLSSDETAESVRILCEKLIPQLEYILRREQRQTGNRKLDEYFLDEFFNVIEEFKWIKSCIEENKDAGEFSYDSWCEAFNEYLEQLYDMGDTITIQRGFSDSEKFLWVG